MTWCIASPRPASAPGRRSARRTRASTRWCSRPRRSDGSATGRVPAAGARRPRLGHRCPRPQPHRRDHDPIARAVSSASYRSRVRGGRTMSRLEGKVALVTGASKGIGAGIAKGLAAAGASVAVNYASDRSSAAAVVAAITASGGRAILVPGDVSKSADVARLFVETKAAYGALDVLVNNAAVYRV